MPTSSGGRERHRDEHGQLARRRSRWGSLGRQRPRHRVGRHERPRRRRPVRARERRVARRSSPARRSPAPPARARQARPTGAVPAVPTPAPAPATRLAGPAPRASSSSPGSRRDGGGAGVANGLGGYWSPSSTEPTELPMAGGTGTGSAAAPVPGISRPAPAAPPSARPACSREHRERSDDAHAFGGQAQLGVSDDHVEVRPAMDRQRRASTLQHSRCRRWPRTPPRLFGALRKGLLRGVTTMMAPGLSLASGWSMRIAEPDSHLTPSL